MKRDITVFAVAILALFVWAGVVGGPLPKPCRDACQRKDHGPSWYADCMKCCEQTRHGEPATLRCWRDYCDQGRNPVNCNQEVTE